MRVSVKIGNGATSWRLPLKLRVGQSKESSQVGISETLAVLWVAQVLCCQALTDFAQDARFCDAIDEAGVSGDPNPCHHMWSSTNPKGIVILWPSLGHLNHSYQLG